MAVGIPAGRATTKTVNNCGGLAAAESTPREGALSSAAKSFAAEDSFGRVDPESSARPGPKTGVSPCAPGAVAARELGDDPAASAARFGIRNYAALRDRFASHGLSVDAALLSADQWIEAELRSTRPAPERWDEVVGAIRRHLGSRIEKTAARLPDAPPADGDPDMRWTVNAELVEAFGDATPLLFAAKAALLHHGSPEFRAAIDADPAGSRLHLRLRDSAEVLRQFAASSDVSELPSGLLGAPGFFTLNREQHVSDAFKVAGLHHDLTAFRGNHVRAYLFTPRDPIDTLTFLAPEDIRVEQEAMLYYLAAAGLQATPYVGAAAGLAADLRDVFSDHDATLSYLKEAGLVDPRYSIEKHAWENAAAAAGVLLTVVGAQAATRLPKLARALKRLGPNGGARLRVAMRQLSTRVMGRRAPNAERLALSDTLSKPAEAIENSRQDIIRDTLPGRHRINPQETGILRSAEHRLAEGELPPDASRAMKTTGGPRATPHPSVFGPADPDTQIPQTGPAHGGPDVFGGLGVGSAFPSRNVATAIAQGQALVPSELQSAMASIHRVIGRMSQARPPDRGLEKAYAKAVRRATHHMAAFREAMLGRSIVSPDEAGELAAAVFKDFSVRNDETVNRYLAEAIRWTDGKGLTTIERIGANSNRAFASFENRTIDVGYSQFELKETLLHEFGHHWEFTDPEARAAAYEWRAARATSGLPVAFLGDDVLPDHFISPYVGRFYPDNGATEVLSMGLQYLSNPEYMVELMLGDMEHFHLMMGLLRGEGRQ